MACCIITAYVMNRLIKACEVLNLDIINIQYNEFDAGPGLENQRDHGKSQDLKLTKLSIGGMTCDACTSAIETAIRGLKGVEAMSVSLSLARASVVHNPTTISVADLIAAVESRGYSARPGERTAKENLDLARHVADLERLQRTFTGVTMLASLVATLDWLKEWLPVSSTSHTFLSLLSLSTGAWIQFVEARWIHNNAWQSGIIATPTMDTLISLSLILGLILSTFNLLSSGIIAAEVYFSSGSFLVVIITGGRYLDTLLRRQTANSLAQLFSLQSDSATAQVRRRVSSQEVECDATTKNPQSYIRVSALTLQPGDEIFIDPGLVIPCDCYVVSGTGLVDEATMTGESLPATKRIGDFLISGTCNLTCELRAIVLKPAGDSALEHLLTTVSDATYKEEADGPPAMLSSSFVRIIISIAVVGALATYVSASKALACSIRLDMAGQRAMAILASACPCALGLAAPSALMSGMSVAWKKGIVIRGGSNTMSRLQTLTQVVMDKTGTLTTGQLSVSSVEGVLDTNHYLMMAAAERHAALTHPVAKTLFQWSLQQMNENQRSEEHQVPVLDISSHHGMGISCKVKLPHRSIPDLVHIGSETYFQDSRISIPLTKTLTRGNEIGIHFAVNNQHVASLNLQDTIRKETPMLIENLQREFGLTVSMLTGDTSQEAKRVSGILGIPVLSAKALPHDKGAYIQELQFRGQKVAMVGDGLNDMPALSLADVGVLLSPGLTRSNSAQVQVADIILTTPSLSKLLDLMVIARMTVEQIQWNVRWAITYNVISVALAMGLLESWGVKIDATRAGTLMALSSVSVVGWSLWFDAGWRL